MMRRLHTDSVITLGLGEDCFRVVIGHGAQGGLWWAMSPDSRELPHAFLELIYSAQPKLHRQQA